ncbi:hypothetical protein H7J77_16230 [Mycolicibacillus parakoreensis]|uniref:Secreted protein n=1 Tax=Mycolicibacillus parakoreensis TaxID=1069221 RepID=A0ABY3TYL0_9MYCO|nr:hypothetical protein [Mycolicibacillus parakoreensis]MCV7317087.1 hypothetical protein [Mycolicibacillus parakoreensis]ULN51411.1 hypothetical protein MIU77_10825 [Mycolicibacillus parakoreensis]
MVRRIVGAALAALIVGTVAAPVAGATMPFGNYDVQSNRWTDRSWVWAVYPCEVPGGLDDLSGDCVLISALDRPHFFGRQYYGGTARLVDGSYSFSTDVSDGLRCPHGFMPSHDTYTWDANTLVGVIESRFDVGCFDGPAGMNTWTFALVRM